MGARVAVAGASGYAGGELLRLLAGHPDLEIGPLTAGSQRRRPGHVRAPEPHRARRTGRSAPADPAALAGADLVFMALPHGGVRRAGRGSCPAGDQVVDLGADFRLADPAAWARFYGGEHAGHWTYGLPELPGARERIRASRTGSPRPAATPPPRSWRSPRCWPRARRARRHRHRRRLRHLRRRPRATADLLGSEVMGAMSAYKAGGAHRHTPEIEQALQGVLGPAARGAARSRSRSRRRWPRCRAASSPPAPPG